MRFCGKHVRKSGDSVRLRRSRTLAVFFERSRYRVVNYLQQKEFLCDSEVLDLLITSDEWREDEEFFCAFPHHRRISVAHEIGRLLDASALVAEGTPQADEEQMYEQRWVWGETAALYHFAIKNSRFLDGQ